MRKWFHFHVTSSLPSPPLVLRHKLVDIEAIWFERNAILQKETLQKLLKLSFR